MLILVNLMNFRTEVTARISTILDKLEFVTIYIYIILKHMNKNMYVTNSYILTYNSQILYGYPLKSITRTLN